MIKKKIFCLWAAALILSGCAGVFQGKEKETEPDFVLTYAENQAEDYPTTQGADKFAELVKEKTEGKVEILVNAGGSLGDEKSVIEQLQFGGIDFARVSISTVAEYIPKLNVLQMPYLYTGADHMWKVLEGPIGDDFLNSFDGSGLIALSWYDAGARSFYNSIKPIEKLEDIKGMTIRVQESEYDPSPDPGTDGEGESYKRDLRLIFPFCIPFDFIHFIQALSADPVAPCFKIPIKLDSLGIDMVLELDLAWMDPVMEIFRLGELGCFVIMLMAATKKMIGW